MLPKVADNTADLLLTSVNAATDGNVTDAKLYTLHFHTLTKGDLVDLGWIDCSSANEYNDTASPLGSLYVSVI